MAAYAAKGKRNSKCTFCLHRAEICKKKAPVKCQWEVHSRSVCLRVQSKSPGGERGWGAVWGGWGGAVALISCSDPLSPPQYSELRTVGLLEAAGPKEIANLRAPVRPQRQPL